MDAGVFLRHAACVAIAVLFALAGQANAQTGAKGAYQPPEDFAGHGGAEYVAQAQRFLQEQPDALEAPRAALDLMMVGAVQKNKPLADAAMARLVLDYPASLQAAYVATTFGQNHGQYASFLQQQFTQTQKASALDEQGGLSPEFCRKFCRAVELGLRQWGPGFLAGDDFLLQAALAADEAGAYPIERLCREKLSEAKEEARQIAEIAFDPLLSRSQQYLRLHEIKDNRQARIYQSHCWRRLRDKDRQLVEVRTVRAASLLEEKRFDAALPILEALLSEAPSDQLRYWHGWCLAGRGRCADAAGALERLCRLHPESPYRAAAEEFARAARSQDVLLGEHARALDQALRALREGGAEKLEATFVLTPRNKPSVECYVALAMGEGESLEVVVRRAQETILAYRNGPDGCRIFTRGDAAIHAFRQGGSYLDLQFQLHTDPQGEIHFAWHANLTSSPGGLQRGLEGLLASPLLSGEEGAAALLRWQMSGGALPAAPRMEIVERVYEVIQPTTRGPELERFAWRLGDAGQLTSFRGPRFACRDVRYGAGEAFAFSPPTWPSAPVASHEKMDAAVMFRLMAAAMTLLEDD